MYCIFWFQSPLQVAGCMQCLSPPVETRLHGWATTLVCRWLTPPRTIGEVVKWVSACVSIYMCVCACVYMCVGVCACVYVYVMRSHKRYTKCFFDILRFWQKWKLEKKIFNLIHISLKSVIPNGSYGILKLMRCGSSISRKTRLKISAWMTRESPLQRVLNTNQNKWK